MNWHNTFPVGHRFTHAIRVLAVALAVLTRLASAQEAATADNFADDSAETPPEPARVIVFDPAAEPLPALRYQLLPPVEVRRAGNSVPIYLRIIHRRADDWKREVSDGSSALLEGSIDAMWLETAKTHLSKFTDVLAELRSAGRRTGASWEYVLEGFDPVMVLLPDAQWMRAYARLLGAQARYEIATGQLEQAVATLQDMLALGHHSAKAPFLVNQLIGMAIANMALERVAEFIAQPGAPNLYWALSALNVVSMQPGLETEDRMLELKFPELADMGQPRSAEQWKQLAAAMRSWAGELLDAPKDQLDTHRIKVASSPAAAQLESARAYLGEKQQLQFDPRAMSDAEVEVRYTVAIYHELVEEIVKWYHLPPWQALSHMSELNQRLTDQARRREFYPLVSLMLVTGQLVEAQVRAERGLAVLRTIEALRMHAAEDGRLPQKLDDITLVGVPMDPATNQPFRYWYTSDGAVLDVADPPESNRRLSLIVPVRLKLRAQ